MSSSCGFEISDKMLCFRKIKNPTFRDRLEYLYFIYSINLGVILYEPWEARLINFTICSLLVMSLYTFCVYFPPYLCQLMMYVGVMGNDAVKVDSNP